MSGADAHGEWQGLAVAVYPIARDGEAAGRLARIQQLIIFRHFARDAICRTRACGESSEDSRDPKHKDWYELQGYLAGAPGVVDQSGKPRARSV
jgi:hypothetical protein